MRLEVEEGLLDRGAGIEKPRAGGLSSALIASSGVRENLIGLLPSTSKAVACAPICDLARARASTITTRPATSR
jgi:hypothetical protein